MLSGKFYALGWATDTWYGVQEVSHGGGVPQVSVFLYLLPAKGFVVAFPIGSSGYPGNTARISRSAVTEVT